MRSSTTKPRPVLHPVTETQTAGYDGPAAPARALFGSRWGAKRMVPDGDGSRAYLELDDSALLAQCNVDTYRARGPGGQKRNKTDSAVRLRHRPTHVMSIAVESRSQHQNRAKALKRLRLAIALQIRGSLDPRSYRLSNTLRACMNEHRKLGVGRRDARRPVVIGEVFDVLWSLKGRVSTAAECLGITTANLSAFLCADPKLKAEANRMRQVFGLRPLR